MKRTLVVALAGAALCGCGGREPEQIETQAAVPVETAVARTGAVTAWVHATGLVEGAPGADWTLTAPQLASIAAVRAAAGDTVRRGDELVSFDSPQLRTDLATRSGELAQAKARLDNAQRGYERLSKLLERGIASTPGGGGRAQGARRRAGRARDARPRPAPGPPSCRAAPARVAPFDGIVAQRWHNAGDLVDANEHVLRLVDPRRLEVAAAVPAADAARIVVGRPARVSVAGSTAEPVAARVVSRPALVDPATGTASVRLRLDGAPPAGTRAASMVESRSRPRRRRDALHRAGRRGRRGERRERRVRGGCDEARPPPRGRGRPARRRRRCSCARE